MKRTLRARTLAKRRAVVALLMCGVMGACEPVGSIHALYTQEVIVAEPKLIGTWDSFDGGRLFTTVRIEQGDGKTYQGTAQGAEGDESVHFTLAVVRLGNGLFADVSFPPADAQRNPESGSAPPHTLCRLKVGEHTLELMMLTEFLLERLKDDARVSIPYERRNQALVMTAPTAELQSVLTRHGAELFDETDRLLLYRRETDGRMVTLKKELAGNSTDPESYRTLGELYLERGQYEDARAAFQQALKLDPKSTVYMDELGDALVALGQYDDARAVYGSIPGHPGVGVTYYLERRYEEAAQALERFDDSDSVIWRSLALEHLGQPIKAYELRSKFQGGDKKKGGHGWAYDPSDYLNNRTTEKEFLAFAKESEEYCLALVIIAERQLLRGEPRKAQETLAKAVATKRYGDFGYIAAKALLARASQ